jgi:NAD(P)-dependent dehydrogenase (short-subunit alcohol dehydrogenase family)
LRLFGSADKLKPRRLRVNISALNYVDSERNRTQSKRLALTQMGRNEEPEDVADAVLFLASDASGFMTGQGINVTGGVRMD